MERLRGHLATAPSWRIGSARLALAGAMVVAAILLAWWAGNRSFALDEWEYVVNRGDWTLSDLIRPANGHLLALPLVVYKAILSTFGAESHVPFTILTIVLSLLVAGLVFAIAARRLHPWIALIPAGLFLFYGSGWEVLINTAAMQNQFGIAAGLGMILCLDRRRYALASVLLLASLASFTIGLAFAAGAAIRLLAEGDPRGRLRRMWVVALPMIPYVAWFLWAQKYHQSGGSLHSLGTIVSGVFDQLSTIMGGLTGLFQKTGGASPGAAFLETTNRTDALVYVLVGIFVLRLVKGPRLTPAAWGALATLLAYLLLIGYGLDSQRLPEASRYVYMGSLLLVVAGIELTAGLRLERRWVLGLVALAAISLYSNVAQIYPAGNFFQDESEYNRAELAALELARPVVEPGFIPEQTAGPDLVPHQDLLFPAADYFAMTAKYGSPAFSEQELEGASDDARQAADALSIRALGVAVGPKERASPTAPPLAPMDGLNAESLQRGPCLLVRPLSAGTGYASVGVPAEGLDFSASAGLQLGLRRFADSYSSDFPQAQRSGSLQIVPDLSSRPWVASLTITGPVRVCPA